MIPEAHIQRFSRRLGGSPDAGTHSDRAILTERTQDPSPCGRNASIFTMPELARDVLSVVLIFALVGLVYCAPDIAHAFTVLRGLDQ